MFRPRQLIRSVNTEWKEMWMPPRLQLGQSSQSRWAFRSYFRWHWPISVNSDTPENISCPRARVGLQNEGSRTEALIGLEQVLVSLFKDPPAHLSRLGVEEELSFPPSASRMQSLWNIGAESELGFRQHFNVKIIPSLLLGKSSGRCLFTPFMMQQ